MVGPSHDNSSAAVVFTDVSRSFRTRRALDGVSLTVEPGEMVALIGPSGAGKSTLMRLAAGLLESDRGPSSVCVFGRVIQRNGRVSRRVRRLRAEIGFIFQQFNLVGRLSLLTNVLTGTLSRVPMWRRPLRWFTREEKLAAMKALDHVGMAEYAGQRASTLSGGQQQRGAIARAVVQGAKVILADEPIASLDPESARLVMESLAKMNRDNGVTVVVSVHQLDYAVRYFQRVIAMKDGRVACDCPSDGLDAGRLRDIYGPNVMDMLSYASRMDLETGAGDEPRPGTEAEDALREAKAGI